MLTLAILAPLLFAPQGIAGASSQPEDEAPGLEQDSALFAPLDAGWNVDIGGALKLAALWSDNVDIYGTDGSSAFSVAAARLWVDSEIADGLKLHVGLRGERGNPRSYLGISGELGEVRTVDTYVDYALADDWDVVVGKFRPPFTSSSMYEEQNTLFFDRSYIGEAWDFYDTGAMLRGKLGPLRGWFSAQNGFDSGGNNVALTGRGVWDVFGGGVERDYEGGWDAPEGLALSLGAAMYYDTSSDNFSSQSLEALATFSRLYLAAEMNDNGDGLGSLYSWGLTASYMLTDDLELAARAEGFSRADDTDLVRAQINKYLRGHAAKWQLGYSKANSHAPLADSGIWLFGLTVAF